MCALSCAVGPYALCFLHFPILIPSFEKGESSSSCARFEAFMTTARWSYENTSGLHLSKVVSCSVSTCNPDDGGRDSARNGLRRHYYTAVLIAFKCPLLLLWEQSISFWSPFQQTPYWRAGHGSFVFLTVSGSRTEEVIAVGVPLVPVPARLVELFAVLKVAKLPKSGNLPLHKSHELGLGLWERGYF